MDGRMTDHGKLDWSQIRPISPEEADRVLREVSQGEITITGTFHEITEENAWWIYYPRSPN